LTAEVSRGHEGG